MTDPKSPMSRLAALLLENKRINRAGLDVALSVDDQCHLIERLVSAGLVDESLVVSDIAENTGRPRVSLDEATPEERVLSTVSGHICARFLVLPIEISNSSAGKHLILAMADPLDVDAIRAVHGEADMRISPLIARASAVRRAIERCYGINAPMPAAIPKREDVLETVRPQVFDDLFDDLDTTFGSLFDRRTTITTEADALALLRNAMQRSVKTRDQLLMSLILSLVEAQVVDALGLIRRLRDPNDATTEETAR
jgi:hypothetical protein